MWHRGDEWKMFSDPYHSSDAFPSITPHKQIDHAQMIDERRSLVRICTHSAVQYLTLTLDCIQQAQPQIIIQAQALLINADITEMTPSM